MAIYQGVNDPIVLEFDDSVEFVKKLSIGLYDLAEHEVKHWSLEDTEVFDKTIECPLTQEETSSFHPGWYNLEVKLLNEDDALVLFTAQAIEVRKRSDKEYLL